MRNLILVFAILFSTMTFAQTSVNANFKEGAKMSFTSTTVDYGTILQGSNRYRTVSFVNDGTEPLIIKKATGSCGCTVPTYPERPIAPGEKAEMKINYDTNRIGSFNKTVTILTNAGTKTLRVVGKVENKATTPTKKSGSILDQ